jgi:hypothetical protein
MKGDRWAYSGVAIVRQNRGYASFVRNMKILSKRPAKLEQQPRRTLTWKPVVAVSVSI